ncbi:MAG: ABC transporter ATP-binding protein [Defluviitaleaceae bacterium]|nr:ABC transporter ATP-binding protein [Defluviitaleaceae bacterium]
MSQTMAVETFGLTKRFKTATAVNNIDLAVPQGAICGFLGKNGAGKTTTIKMLTGMKKPTSGEFAIMGKKETFGKGIRAVGYLPDVPGFYGYMTGWEFLDLCARLCNMPENERKSHVDDLLKQVGLDGVKTKISGYSRGMRQRLGIAQALVNSPAVVFMDEPISALDPMGRRDIMEIISSLRGKTSVVLSTHILSDVENICDHIIIIEKGNVVEQGTLAEIKSRFTRQDSVKITFYNQDDCDKFGEQIRQAASGGLNVTDDAMRIIIQSDNITPAEISKLSAKILSNAAMPFKGLHTDAPTLDDIFYEVTK